MSKKTRSLLFDLAIWGACILCVLWCACCGVQGSGDLSDRDHSPPPVPVSDLTEGPDMSGLADMTDADPPRCLVVGGVSCSQGRTVSDFRQTCAASLCVCAAPTGCCCVGGGR